MTADAGTKAGSVTGGHGPPVGEHRCSSGSDRFRTGPKEGDDELGRKSAILRQQVVENIAPVLTRVFTPLTVAMLLVLLPVPATAGGFVDVDRNLLVLKDAILVLVLCLLLYSISARDRAAGFGGIMGL
jgi:hypothetical protein